MDAEDRIILITCLIGGLIIIAILIFYFVFQYPKDKAKEILRRKQVEEEYEKEPKYCFVRARVVSRKKTLYYQSELRMPTLPAQKQECFVSFLTEEGETLTFQIREELFDGIQEGQEGTLVTVNGNFFDFGDGEDVALEDEETE